MLSTFVVQDIFNQQASLVEDEYDPNPQIDISIKNITSHPDYSSRRKYHDIALIELMQDVAFTYYARPACLYHSDVQIKPPLLISGWGRISSDTSELSPWLLKAEVQEVDFDQCKSKYDSLVLNSLPDGMIKSQLCATGQKENKTVDACQGKFGLHFYIHNI